jgi:hypothetical protein
MNIPQDYRFTIRGLSCKRMAYALSVVSLFLLPVHFYVPCEVSAAVGGLGMLLALSAAIVPVFIPPGVPSRFGPVPLAIFILLLQLLAIH